MSDYINRKASRSLMGVPCWIWVWYLQATQSFVSNSCRTEVEEGELKPEGSHYQPTMKQWIIGLESLDLLPVKAWNSSTQWTCSHGIYVPVFQPNSSAHSKTRFTLLVRLTLAPCLISFLTIPTIPFLAAIMRGVSWDSWNQINARNTTNLIDWQPVLYTRNAKTLIFKWGELFVLREKLLMHWEFEGQGASKDQNVSLDGH